MTDTTSVEQLENSVGRLPLIVERLLAERLFVVLDEVAYESSGAKQELEPFFQSHSTVRFTDFELNPKIEDIQRGIQLCREFQPDVVIAFGGGTAIDLAKLIGTLSRQPEAPAGYITGQRAIEIAGPPMIAIPTTAGTGSEATHFAVAYIAGKKFSCAHSTLLPGYAIVDPMLTASLPPRMTAATGLDAFCQAIESIWAVGATEASLNWASEAAKLAYQNLAQATNSPTTEARAAMSRASHLAGKAINISKTTAPHALSYHLTSKYGIPHGIAVAMNLAPLLKYNSFVTDADCADPRGAADVQKRIASICQILEAEDVQAACHNITVFLSKLDCPASMREAGIVKSDEIKRLIETVNLERLSNNPRKATCETLADLFSGENPNRAGAT